MKQLLNSIVLAAIVVTGGALWAAEKSPIEVKSDSLRQLQDLRSENVKRLQDIDRALSKSIDENASDSTTKEVESLKAEKHEHVLRQAFLDRLIFQLDTKFSGGDLRAFLERSLTDMAKVDATSNANSSDSLWKFFKYSADAIRRLPEQKENILAFLEGYMNRSVSNPVLPEEYLASRNYTNGARSESGKPLSREEVGAFADRRLHQANPGPVLHKAE